MFMGTSTGIVRATMRPPASIARRRRLELARHPLGHARVDGEHVPVDRSLGGDGHVDQQIDLVVGELIETAVDDAFERGALVLAGGLAQARAPRPGSTSGTEPARRHRPSASSTRVVENPRPPAAIESCRSSTMASSWAGSASLPTDASPIT